MKLPAIPEILDTKRLRIRAPRLADSTAVTEAVHESLEELKPWMPWATDDYDLEGCEESLRRAVANFVTRKDLRYHVFERDSGELIGSTGLHRINWNVPRFEIGYWVRTSRAGKGYTSEAVRELTRVAFRELGARRVDIRCDDRNRASARVAEKCGFELESILRNWSVGTDGTVRDERVYRLIDLSGLTTA